MTKAQVIIALLASSVSADGMPGDLTAAPGKSIADPKAKAVSDPGNVTSGSNACNGSMIGLTFDAPESIPYLDSTTPYLLGFGSSSYFKISPNGQVKSAGECDINDCKLFDETCLKPFTNPHIKIGDKKPFQVTVATNVRDGYSAEFCYSCWSIGYPKSSTPTGNYAKANTKVVVAAWIDPNCPKPGSKIMEVKTERYGEKISDWMCTPTNDPSDGVSVYPTICKGNVLRQKLAKANGPEEYKYVCQPLCKFALKVIDKRPAGNNSVIYDKTKPKTELTTATYNNWFENLFKSQNRCDITKCELRNQGCKSAYAGGKVEVTNDGSKIKFSTTSNIPDGYSETVCVACSNAGGGIVYKDNWIVEQNQEDCRDALTKNPTQLPEQDINYKIISPTYNIGAGWETFFALSTKRVCGITGCELMTKDCAAPYKTGKDANLQIEKRSPWTLQAKMVEAGYTETVCIKCSNGPKSSAKSQNVVVTQRKKAPNPHPTMATVCDVGDDSKCIGLYGYQYCCMSIQALNVTPLHAQNKDQRTRIAEFEAYGYPTRANQGRVLMCQNRPNLDHITTSPNIVAEITTMPITFQAYCAGAQTLQMFGGALAVASSLYL